VRTHLTGLPRRAIAERQNDLANAIYRHVPVGVGAEGKIALDDGDMTAMLSGGAAWALERGWGRAQDLERIEEYGRCESADPAAVSDRARKRQRREMGTLGSGNHYLEVQEIAEIFDFPAAAAYGLKQGECVVTIHCGSRGLGHQIGTEFLSEMAEAGEAQGIALPDRELACAPITSELGRRYIGAMRAATNCALANRQIIGHLARQVFAQFFAHAELPLLFDVSHNTCKLEEHQVGGVHKLLYVHRKGATRAFGRGHPSLPEALKPWGQPVLIGGSMGTQSYILAGADTSEARAFSSACHGAGRQMSRHQALKTWMGRQIIGDLKARGIIVRSPSARGVTEEAPRA
jgi:tRNA-splicing ligase RtcB